MQDDRSTNPAPHELANELTNERSVQARGGLPDTRRVESAPSGSQSDRPMRVERRLARTMTLVVLAAIVIGLLVAAILFRNMAWLGFALLFLIPFILLVSMPVWLAGAVKQSQDETVREQKGAT
jgi:hypothetical protein